jgi:hypothetical protein
LFQQKRLALAMHTQNSFKEVFGRLAFIFVANKRICLHLELHAQHVRLEAFKFGHFLQNREDEVFVYLWNNNECLVVPLVVPLVHRVLDLPRLIFKFVLLGCLFILNLLHHRFDTMPIRTQPFLISCSKNRICRLETLACLIFVLISELLPEIIAPRQLTSISEKKSFQQAHRIWSIPAVHKFSIGYVLKDNAVRFEEPSIQNSSVNDGLQAKAPAFFFEELKQQRCDDFLVRQRLWVGQTGVAWRNILLRPKVASAFGWIEESNVLSLLLPVTLVVHKHFVPLDGPDHEDDQALWSAAGCEVNRIGCKV